MSFLTEFLDVIGTKVCRFFSPCYSQSSLPLLSKSGLKRVCTVNIVLKSENSQDYAQKPQRNCTFMNLASVLYARLNFYDKQFEHFVGWIHIHYVLMSRSRNMEWRIYNQETKTKVVIIWGRQLIFCPIALPSFIPSDSHSNFQCRLSNGSPLLDSSMSKII